MAKSNTFLFVSAVLMAVWFAFMGMFWTYLIALFVAYPFGVFAYLIWRKIRKDGRKRNISIPIILGTGLFASIVVLIYLLIFG